MATIIVEHDKLAVPTTVEVLGERGITQVKWEPVFKVYAQEEWAKLQAEWERDKVEKIDVLKQHLLKWNLLEGDGGDVEFSDANKEAVLNVPVYQNAAWNAFIAAHVPSVRKRVSLGN